MGSKGGLPCLAFAVAYSSTHKVTHRYALALLPNLELCCGEDCVCGSVGGLSCLQLARLLSLRQAVVRRLIYYLEDAASTTPIAGFEVRDLRNKLFLSQLVRSKTA